MSRRVARRRQSSWSVVGYALGTLVVLTLGSAVYAAAGMGPVVLAVLVVAVFAVASTARGRGRSRSRMRRHR